MAGACIKKKAPAKAKGDMPAVFNAAPGNRPNRALHASLSVTGNNLPSQITAANAKKICQDYLKRGTS